MNIPDVFFDLELEYERDPERARKLVTELFADEQAVELRMAFNAHVFDRIRVTFPDLSRSEGSEQRTTSVAERVVEELSKGRLDLQEAADVLRDNTLLNAAAAFWQIQTQQAQADPVVLPSNALSPRSLDPVLQRLWATIRDVVPTDLSWWEARLLRWNDSLPDLAGLFDEDDGFEWRRPSGIVCTRVGRNAVVEWRLHYVPNGEALFIETLCNNAKRSVDAVSVNVGPNGSFVRVDGAKLVDDWQLFHVRREHDRDATDPSKTELFAVAPPAKPGSRVRQNEPLRDAVALENEGRLVEAWTTAIDVSQSAREQARENTLRLQLLVYDLFWTMEQLAVEIRPLVKSRMDRRAAATLVDRRLDMAKQSILGAIPAFPT